MRPELRVIVSTLQGPLSVQVPVERVKRVTILVSSVEDQ